jgi:hypothetical protein
MADHDLHHTVSLLTRTPANLDALLRDLPEVWTHRNEGEGNMSAFDVVGHLIHGERANWMPRARTLLQFGESVVGVQFTGPRFQRVFRSESAA